MSNTHQNVLLESRFYRMCFTKLCLWEVKSRRESQEKVLPVVRIKPGSLTHRTTQRTIVYLITDWIKGNGKLFFSFKWGSRHICVRVCACLCVSRCQGQTIRHCYSIECQLTTDSKNMKHHKHLMLFAHPICPLRTRSAQLYVSYSNTLCISFQPRTDTW